MSPSPHELADFTSRCQGKKRYARRADAVRALAKRDHHVNKDTLRVYKCGWCGGAFHIGHVRDGGHDDEMRRGASKLRDELAQAARAETAGRSTRNHVESEAEKRMREAWERSRKKRTERGTGRGTADATRSEATASGSSSAICGGVEEC